LLSEACMKRPRGWIALGLLGAGGLWLALRPAPMPPPSGDDALPAEAAAVAIVTEAAEAPTSPAPPAIANAAAAPPAPQPPAAIRKGDDPDAPYAFAETPEDLSERVAEREELGSRFARETADAPWTVEAGRKVAELLARGNLPSGALRAVDCRQTICRFVLASSTNTTREVGGLLQAARDFEEETWIHPEKQGDGTWRTEVFFPKQGYRLSGGGGRIDEVKRATSEPDQQRSSKGG
jgi:hypothetical protein